MTSFLASNNMRTDDQMMSLVEWTISENHVAQLSSLLQVDINTPTGRSLAQRVVKAAVDSRNICSLRNLLLAGVDFKPVIKRAICIADDDFVELMLSKVDTTCISGASGRELLVACVWRKVKDSRNADSQASDSKRCRCQFRTIWPGHSLVLPGS